MARFYSGTSASAWQAVIGQYQKVLLCLLKEFLHMDFTQTNSLEPITSPQSTVGLVQ